MTLSGFFVYNKIMNYYEILGISETADAAEIKKSYRKLASQHHPDKGGDTARFQEIQAAYDTLADPDKRQRYDMERQGQGGPHIHWHTGSNGHPDIGDIFRNFGFAFGGGGGTGDPFQPFRQPQQRRNKDMRIEIPIALADTLTEQTKTISVQTTNGERQTVEVNIPRGMSNGTQIKYAGLGDNLFNTLPRGDLYVQFTVHDAEGFIVNNIDLHTKTSVNCLQAIVGTEITVTGLDNKEFAITVPAGIQPGTRFRIPQQGLYQLNSIIRGDLYVEIAITVPKDLPEHKLETIRNLLNSQ